MVHLKTYVQLNIYLIYSVNYFCSIVWLLTFMSVLTDGYRISIQMKSLKYNIRTCIKESIFWQTLLICVNTCTTSLCNCKRNEILSKNNPKSKIKHISLHEWRESCYWNYKMNLYEQNNLPFKTNYRFFGWISFSVGIKFKRKSKLF